MSDEEKKPDPQRAEFARAAQDLEDILALKKFIPFNRYFTRRITQEVKKAAAQILDPSTKDELIHDLKVRHRTMEEIAKLLEVDESGCRSIIASAPKEPTESEDPETTG